MSIQEQVAMKDLVQQFNVFVNEDKEWKDKIEKQLKPILKERADRKIIQDFWRTAFHIAATIIAFCVSVGMLIHYVVQPTLGNFKQ